MKHVNHNLDYLEINGSRQIDARLDGIEPVLARADGCRLLDVGCAEGDVSRAFLNAGAVSVDGIEECEEKISRAKKKFSELNQNSWNNGKHFRFFVFDTLRIEEFLKDKEPYDIVLALGLYNFIEIELFLLIAKNLAKKCNFFLVFRNVQIRSPVELRMIKDALAPFGFELKNMSEGALDTNLKEYAAPVYAFIKVKEPASFGDSPERHVISDKLLTYEPRLTAHERWRRTRLVTDDSWIKGQGEIDVRDAWAALAKSPNNQHIVKSLYSYHQKSGDLPAFAKNIEDLLVKKGPWQVLYIAAEQVYRKLGDVNALVSARRRRANTLHPGGSGVAINVRRAQAIGVDPEWSDFGVDYAARGKTDPNPGVAILVPPRCGSTFFRAIMSNVFENDPVIIHADTSNITDVCAHTAYRGLKSSKVLFAHGIANKHNVAVFKALRIPVVVMVRDVLDSMYSFCEYLKGSKPHFEMYTNLPSSMLDKLSQQALDDIIIDKFTNYFIDFCTTWNRIARLKILPTTQIDFKDLIDRPEQALEKVAAGTDIPQETLAEARLRAMKGNTNKNVGIFGRGGQLFNRNQQVRIASFLSRYPETEIKDCPGLEGIRSLAG